MTSTTGSTPGAFRLAQESTSHAFRLRGRVLKATLTVHILAAVGWFGTAVVIAFCAIAAATTSDLTLSHALYRTMETMPWLSIPVGLVAVATGMLMGFGTKWGIVRYRWVLGKLAIAVTVIATDALVVKSAAHHAVVSGIATRPLFGATIGHVMLLTVAASLAVFKPGGRTRWGQRHGALAELNNGDGRASTNLASG